MAVEGSSATDPQLLVEWRLGLHAHGFFPDDFLTYCDACGKSAEGREIAASKPPCIYVHTIAREVDG